MNQQRLIDFSLVSRYVTYVTQLYNLLMYNSKTLDYISFISTFRLLNNKQFASRTISAFISNHSANRLVFQWGGGDKLSESVYQLLRRLKTVWSSSPPGGWPRFRYLALSVNTFKYVLNYKYFSITIWNANLSNFCVYEKPIGSYFFLRISQRP